jgi:UDP-N-acetylmuramoyl-L-alanyl-D-glutamate--2,6-diaminopimelate ligase
MNALISLPRTFPVACHTDFVGEGSTFVAIEGYADNGVNYIKKAIENGARTIVVHHTTLLSDELSEFMRAHEVALERVDNTRKALADLSAQAAHYPARKLKIIGITGTKGKTTTSFLLAHMLQAAGYKTALISSAQNRIDGHIFAAPLTTPQPDYLQQFLQLCVENNIEYVVMEVAAQALTLHRVEGISFCGIIFTNFSLEHLEFYSNLDDYFRAKCLIFNMAFAHAPIVINGDNEACAPLLDKSSEIGNALSSRYQSIISYGFNKAFVDVQGFNMKDPVYAIEVAADYRDCKNVFSCPRLFGEYNAYNVLAAATMALALHMPSEVIQQALQTFSGVPGRLQEHHLSNGARCFIDYAHNPESFQAVLSTLRALTSQLIVVFGAGGGRDKSKRPMMGLVAAHIADIVMVTSDNPRLEDAVTIAGDIVRDIPALLAHKVIHELDRKKAIEYAYQLSDQGSIIALLGKGPDEYQIIGTTKHYFSERTIIEQL